MGNLSDLRVIYIRYKPQCFCFGSSQNTNTQCINHNLLIKQPNGEIIQNGAGHW